jgi:hypothetical protein
MACIPSLDPIAGSTKTSPLQSRAQGDAASISRYTQKKGVSQLKEAIK